MIISFEIDTNVLKILHINLSQLLFINLIHVKTSKSKIKEFIKLKLISQSEFEELIKNKILTEDSDIEEIETIKLDKDFIKKYKELSKDDFFEEFLNLYPAYVVRPDGIKSFIRNNLKKCKLLYNQIVSNDKDKHNHIIKCLLYEIGDRELTGQMQWMKTMNNWLLQEGWTYAEQRIDDFNDEITAGYGEDIV